MCISTLLIGPLVLAGAFAASSLQGGATRGRWFLDSCPPENGAKAAAVRAEILSAAPGSSVYVPRPFPTTDEQVIEDLEYQFLDLFSRIPRRRFPKTFAVYCGPSSASLLVSRFSSSWTGDPRGAASSMGRQTSTFW